MKKYVGGQYIEMSDEEAGEVEQACRITEELERTRPLTESEVARMVIASQINGIGLDDDTTLRCREFFPCWTCGAYTVGYTVQHVGNLWRCCQGHDSTGNPDWCPGNASSLWAPWHSKAAITALPWVAPTGAHDAYMAGEYMVWSDGIVYKCMADNTVWGLTHCREAGRCCK